MSFHVKERLEDRKRVARGPAFARRYTGLQKAQGQLHRCPQPHPQPRGRTCARDSHLGGYVSGLFYCEM